MTHQNLRLGKCWNLLWATSFPYDLRIVGSAMCDHLRIEPCSIFSDRCDHIETQLRSIIIIIIYQFHWAEGIWATKDRLRSYGNQVLMTDPETLGKKHGCSQSSLKTSVFQLFLFYRHVILWKLTVCVCYLFSYSWLVASVTRKSAGMNQCWRWMVRLWTLLVTSWFHQVSSLTLAHSRWV